MKPLYYFMAVLLLTATLSCSKNKEQPVPSSPATTNTSDDNLNTRIEKKWNVSTPAASKVAASLSDYKSFEFTPNGIYIIIKTVNSKDSIISGTYTLNESDSTITLSKYGFIRISSVSATGFTFTLTLDSDLKTPIKVITTPAPAVVIASNDTTHYITKSWKLIKRTINGVENTAITTALANGTAVANVTFSSYFTFYTEQLAPNQPLVKQNGEWNWASSIAQDRICTGTAEILSSCSNNFGVAFNASGNLILTSVTPPPASQTLVDTYEELVNK